MRVRRSLQISITSVAVLATMLLGLGQRDPNLPLLVLTAATTSIWLTDTFQIIVISPQVANVVAGGGLLAVLLWQMINLRGTALVLGIANVLAYLQIVMLFQQKDNRTCRLILLLSLLQVIVATTLYQRYMFGLLLILYALAGIFSLVLLQVQEALQPSGDVKNGSSVRHPTYAGQFTAAKVVGGRFGLRLRGLSLSLTLQVLALAVLLFAVVPRAGITPWRGLLTQPVRVVGFSDTIRLGELGSIIQSNEEVCRVSFLTYPDRQPYRVAGSIYLRGAVLEEYLGGRWHRPPVTTIVPLPVCSEDLIRQLPEPVWQYVTMEPLTERHLFCLWPFFNPVGGQDVGIDLAGKTLYRSQYHAQRRFAFRLITCALQNGEQVELVPAWEFPDLNQLLALPPRTGKHATPRLTTLADQWLSEARVERTDFIAVARHFERRLRDAGLFSYSLQPQPRTRDLDPVEDFLFVHRKGHCEYFATALALLLRSVGIPTRLVVGFRTEEWSEDGNYFLVRQSHAHSWVEVYLPREKVPQAVLKSSPVWRYARGAWLRLDPTPSAPMEKPNHLAKYLSQLLDRMDAWWDNYVIELDKSRQYKAVYRPVFRAIAKAWQFATQKSSWQQLLHNFGNLFQQFWQAVRTGQWFNWTAGLAAAILAACLIILVWGAVRLVLLLWLAMYSLQQRTPKEASQAVFYRRFEQALKRLGMVRPHSKTPREFALWANSQIAETYQIPLPANGCATVAEAYYQLRYGQKHLEKKQLDQIETILRELEQLAGQVRRPGWLRLTRA